MKINDANNPAHPSSPATYRTSHGDAASRSNRNARREPWSCRYRRRNYRAPHKHHAKRSPHADEPLLCASRPPHHGTAYKAPVSQPSARTRNYYSSDGGSPASRMVSYNPDRDTALASSLTRRSLSIALTRCIYRSLVVSLSFLSNVKVRPPARKESL